MKDFAFPQVWPGKLVGQMIVIPGMTRQEVYAGQVAAGIVAGVAADPARLDALDHEAVAEVAFMIAGELDKLARAVTQQEEAAALAAAVAEAEGGQGGNGGQPGA